MQIAPNLTNQELDMYYQKLRGHLINMAYNYLEDVCEVDLDNFRSVTMTGRVGGFKVIYEDIYKDIYVVNFTKDLELPVLSNVF